MTNLDVMELERLQAIYGDFINKTEIKLSDSTEKSKILIELGSFTTNSPIAKKKAFDIINQINDIPSESSKLSGY
jgi:hypothetical protein